MDLLEQIRKKFVNIEKFKKFDRQKRVVQKDGTTSVLYKNISKKRRRYFSDFYTTLLDSSWGYCVVMFASRKCQNIKLKCLLSFSPVTLSPT